ncbi:MAG: hypothetical protein ABI887_10675 [Burkholderiales bacterium]
MGTKNVTSRPFVIRTLCLAAALFSMSATVQAVDGCKVLLCLAGNWKNISQCRPDVEQAMRDVARGRGWASGAAAASSAGSSTWPKTA